MYVSSYFERTHQKPKTSAPFSLFRIKSDVFCCCCIYSQISLTWAKNITQPQILTQFCSICSHHSQFRIRSDHFTWPTVSTSSLKSGVLQPQLWCPLEDESDVPIVHCQRNSIFSPSAWCSMDLWVLMVTKWWREQGMHQMLLIDCWPPCLFITQFNYHRKKSPTIQLGQQKIRTMGPCYSLCLLGCQRVGAKTSWSKTWKNSSCSSNPIQSNVIKYSN